MTEHGAYRDTELSMISGPEKGRFLLMTTRIGDDEDQKVGFLDF